MTGRLLAVAVGLVAGGAIALTVLAPEPVERTDGIPAVEQHPPGPGDPPVVWLGGTLEEVGETELALREGEGPVIRLGRFAAGATRFLRLRGGEWRDAPGAAQAGDRACIEALLDEGSFLALRVFLGSGCGPLP